MLLFVHGFGGGNGSIAGRTKRLSVVLDRSSNNECERIGGARIWVVNNRPSKTEIGALAGPAVKLLRSILYLSNPDTLPRLERGRGFFSIRVADGPSS